MKYEAHMESFNELYAGIKPIATIRNAQTKIEFRMEEMELASKNNIERAENVYVQNKILLEERDRFLNQTKELVEEKAKMLKEKYITMEQFRIRLASTERNLKEMTEKFQTTDAELKRVEKINALHVDEKNKMKERIIKIKARKGRD
jgi:hypothetical protein